MIEKVKQRDMIYKVNVTRTHERFSDLRLGSCDCDLPSPHIHCVPRL